MPLSNWNEWLPPQRRPAMESLASAYPIFGNRPFSAATRCPDIHPGDIPDGDAAYCPVCHDTGLRHHPGLKETAAGLVRLADWKPPEGGDPWSWTRADHEAAGVEARPERKPDTPTTRKERRAERYGHQAAPHHD